LVDTPGFKDATQIKKHDWTNEDQERGLLGQGLRGLDDDDIILLTDADEIANADALNFYRHFTGAPHSSQSFCGSIPELSHLITPPHTHTHHRTRPQQQQLLLLHQGIHRAVASSCDGRRWASSGRYPPCGLRKPA
jgi:hypothetical protein